MQREELELVLLHVVMLLDVHVHVLIPWRVVVAIPLQLPIE